MATAAQIEANRKNAKRSTGPKTAEGKAKSRLNALSHGLLSRDIVLADENLEDFNALAAELRNDLRPHGVLEELLCERIVLITWRLQRAIRVEAGLFTFALAEERARLARDKNRRIIHEPIERGLELRIFKALKAPIPPEYRRNQEAAMAYELDGMTEQAVWGRAFAQEKLGANALLLLERYETSLERSLYRALNEFDRQQQGRRGAAGDTK
jgi:hypothetical protein